MQSARHLVEPFIANYEKFNSNTGWVSQKELGAVGDALQALSHFSYHDSGAYAGHSVPKTRVASPVPELLLSAERTNASRFFMRTRGLCADGDLVLCDLQGGFVSGGVVLTDPVLMSRDKRFGPTDLGKRGIKQFFNHHRCNQFCRPDAWLRPKLGVPKPTRHGTTMSDSTGQLISTLGSTGMAMTMGSTGAAGATQRSLGASSVTGGSTMGLGRVHGALACWHEYVFCWQCCVHCWHGVCAAECGARGGPSHQHSRALRATRFQPGQARAAVALPCVCAHHHSCSWSTVR